MVSPIGVSDKVSVLEFGAIVIGLVFASQLLVLIANPKILTDKPNEDDVLEQVDARAWRSVVLFGIIASILAISAIEDRGTALANAALLLSAGFSMFTFSMKTIARMRRIALRFQAVAFSVSILLLFTSLYFVIDAINPRDEVLLLLQILILGVLIIWVSSFILQLYRIGKQYNGKRIKWVRKVLPIRGSEE